MRTRFIIAGWTAFVFTLGFIMGMITAGNAHAQPLEDQPGWDCRTMGNRVCGTRVLVCQPTERDGQLYLDQCDWYETKDGQN